MVITLTGVCVGHYRSAAATLIGFLQLPQDNLKLPITHVIFPLYDNQQYTFQLCAPSSIESL
jgi:hypothetical protein